MGFFDRFRNSKEVEVSKFELVADRGDGYYVWNGNLYKSDIVRAAIRPKARAIGKAVGKHLRRTAEETKVNPDVYMRFLLEEPNPMMNGQQLQEKLATQLELNNNAFAYINRDENGLAKEIYPITALSTEAVKDSSGNMYIKFLMKSGKRVTFRYTDIIHLRKDFNNNEIFGDSPADVLTPLMEIVTTTDQGIVKAIKNSNVIRWLLKFNQTLRPEDIKKQTKSFVDDFLSGESESVGAAGVDAKADAKQIEPKDFVPNEKQMNSTVKRIYSFFNTNENIVMATYDENQWISYYESTIEPEIMQLSSEYTRKIFTRRERGFGNKIVFEGTNLAFASMSTKLKLVEFVDRGILNPNEVRQVLNIAPREGGDEYVRRLDTALTKETDNNENDEGR